MNYPKFKKEPLIYILIPVHNSWEYTKKCLDSLQAIKYKNYKIIVINDGSTDNTSKNLKKFYPDVTEIKGNGTLWDSGARNKGIEYILDNKISQDYILSINNDILVDPYFLNLLVEFNEKNKRKYILGPKILYENNRKLVWQFGTGYNAEKVKLYLKFRDSLDGEKFNKNLEVENLTGMAVLIPFEIFSKYGIFWDEKYFPMYYGDTDFVLKTKKVGFKALAVGKSKIYAFVSHSACLSYSRLSFLELLKFINSPKSTFHPKLPARFFYRHYGLRAAIIATSQKSVNLIKLILLKPRFFERHCRLKIAIIAILQSPVKLIRFILSLPLNRRLNKTVNTTKKCLKFTKTKK